MKKLIFALSLLFVFQAHAEKVEFENAPGCMFTDTHAKCILKNNLDVTIRCVSEAHGKNENKTVASFYGNVLIPAHKFETFDLFTKEKFTSINTHSICSFEQK